MPAPAEPERIKIQHILIGFSGSVPGKPITRTLEQAKTLAYDLLKRAKAGEDFAALVKANTDDAFPGIYALANKGVTPQQGEYARTRMVPAFGDAGFPLKVGEIGMAEFDQQKSPYGWHIVKRLE
jgi:parvulin-like peptidyl-prolyl isomerase